MGFTVQVGVKASVYSRATTVASTAIEAAVWAAVPGTIHSRWKSCGPDSPTVVWHLAVAGNEAVSPPDNSKL